MVRRGLRRHVGILFDVSFQEEVGRRREDLVVVADVSQDAKTLFFDPEICRRRQHCGVDAAGDQRRGTTIDVGADRRPFDVVGGETVASSGSDGRAG